MAPHVNYVLDPRARTYHVISPLSLILSLDEYESVSDRRRRLTRQRVQRHRGRTDEARRETARVADCARDLAGRMKLTFAVHRDSLAITHGYGLQLPNCIKASREASLCGQPRMH